MTFRARIVLGAAAGHSNNFLATQLGLTGPTVLLWRKRYAQAGVTDLLRDATRPGRQRRIGALKVEAIVNATLPAPSALHVDGHRLEDRPHCYKRERCSIIQNSK